MFFNSYQFLLFFPIVVCIYYLIPHKIRKIWLVISSYYFYMSWNPKYIVLLLFVTLISYFIGIVISIKSLYSKRKIFVISGIFLILSILVFYKYMDFLWCPIYFILRKMGLEPCVERFDILLPVGISFYTFQSIGYIVDVYRGQVEHEKKFVDYALFISFFPQLVAGPIERTSHLMKQLSAEHSFNKNEFRDGIMLMLWGFFMKLVIADRAAIFVDRVYNC